MQVEPSLDSESRTLVAGVHNASEPEVQVASASAALRLGALWRAIGRYCHCRSMRSMIMRAGNATLLTDFAILRYYLVLVCPAGDLTSSRIIAHNDAILAALQIARSLRIRAAVFNAMPTDTGRRV